MHMFEGTLSDVLAHSFAVFYMSLRKHAYSNILKILLPKLKVFRQNSDIFLIFLLITYILGTR